MSALGNLVVSLALDTAAFTKGVDKSSYEAQKFAQDLDRTLNRSLGAAKQSFIGFGSAALGAIGVVTSVTEAISRLNETFTKFDSLAKDSQRFGIPVEQLSQLQYAADMSGVSIEGLGVALKGMLKNASEAASGEKGPAEVFRALGVAATDANGKVRSSTELIEDFAEVFAGLDDGATKTALALKVFGKSGSELIPLLNSGRDGIRQLNDEATRFGAVVGTDAAKAAEVYQDNLSRLTVSFDSLFKSAASSLLPTLVSVTNEMVAGTSAAANFGTGIEAALSKFTNSVFRDANPAQRIAEIKSTITVIEGFMKAKADGIPSIVERFLRFDKAGLAAKKAELQLYVVELDREIDEILKPPTTLPDGTETAATKQKRENEQREKKEREDRIKQVLAEGEAAKRLAEQRQREAEQRRKQLDLERQYAELMKQIGQQNQSYESLVQYLDEHDDYLKAKEEETRALERELQEVGLSEQALASLRAERLREIATLKEATAAKESDTFAAEKLRKEAEELRKQADIKLQIFDAQSADKEIKKAAEESKRAFESITGDIAQAITSGIADGSIKGQDFIKRLFKTTVVRLAIEPFVKGSVAAALGAFGFGGNAAASGGTEGVASAASAAGGLGNLVSGVQSVYSAITGGFTNTLANFSAEVGKVAFDLSSSLGYSAQQAATFGNSAISATQTFGQIAGGLAVAYGGYQLGRAISGGYAVGGGTGNSAVNTGATIGAIVGSIVPGIGTAIGAALGSIAGGTFNRLFGRKTVLGASGIQGDFTGQGLSNAVGFQDVTQKGGLFRSDKSFTNFFGIDQKAIDAVNEAFLDVRQSVKLASNALSADFTNALFNLNLSGRLGGDLQAVLNNATDELINQIGQVSLGINADFLDFLKGIKQESEKLVDVFVRVSRNVSTANRAMILLGQTAQFSVRNAEDAVALISTLGDQGLQLLDQFNSRFMPVAQQAEAQLKALALTLKNLGLDSKLSANTTREEFAKLVRGLDLTTAAGQRELALLLQVMPELDAIISRREQEKAATSALSSAIEANVKKIRGDFTGLLSAIASRADSLSPNSFRAAIASIQSAVNSVDASPVTDFAASVSAAVPTDSAYRGFIRAVGSMQPEAGRYMRFVDSISGFTPNTAAYRAFTDAVSGIKPKDSAYRDFVASVQGLKPSNALYREFVRAVSTARPSSAGFDRFINQIQGQANSLRAQTVNAALGALKAQIERLENTVVRVDFSRFTTQINLIGSDIGKINQSLSKTTDVTLRLQLEDQLQQAIVARYQLEQEMLGGVFSSIQDLFGSIKSERIAVRQSAIDILGGPRVLTPKEIREEIKGIKNTVEFPDIESVDKKIADATNKLNRATSFINSSENRLESQLSAAESSVYNRQFLENLEKQFNIGKNAEVLTQRLAESLGVTLKGGNLFFTEGFGLNQKATTDFQGVGGAAAAKAEFNEKFKNQTRNIGGLDLTLFDAMAKANQRANALKLAAEQDLAQKIKVISDQSAADVLKAREEVIAQQTKISDLEKDRVELQTKYAEKLQEFVIDAGKATSSLGKLRDETVRYFQEQQRLAQTLMASSQGLRQTVADIRFADLNPQQQLKKLQREFSNVFNSALTLEGDGLAQAGTDLNALINPLLQKAGEVFASGSEFQAIKDSILSQAETLAKRIEKLTPVNYEKDSLALLDTIDTTLGLIEANTKSAEALIVDAIKLSGDRTVNALEALYEGLTGKQIPAFASGGFVSGPGTGTSDSINARLSNGEYVMPAATVRAFGVPMMDAIRSGRMPAIQSGADNQEVVAELRETNRILMANLRLAQAEAQQSASDSAEMRQEIVMLRKKFSLEASQ